MPLASTALLQLAWYRGRPEAAARLIGHAQQAYDQRGMSSFGFVNDLMTEVTEDIAPRLAAGRFAALVQEGRSLSETQALDLACVD